MIDENILDKINGQYKITNRMVLMNKFIEVLNVYTDNFIFKGAVVLTEKIRLDGLVELGRKSLDLDIDCIEDLNQDEIVSIINLACNDLHYKSEVKRNLGENKSLGIVIYNQDNIKLFSIDVGKKEFTDYTICKTINSTKFKAYTIERVIVDKLSVISTNKVCRRIKDLYDLSIIILNYKVYNQQIINSFNKYKRCLGDFNWFYNEQEKLEHAYRKYDGIFNKPTFKEVYYPVLIFVNGFDRDKDKDLVWCREQQEWLLNNSMEVTREKQ